MFSKSDKNFFVILRIKKEIDIFNDFIKDYLKREVY